jgi:hypothetical protein
LLEGRYALTRKFRFQTSAILAKWEKFAYDCSCRVTLVLLDLGRLALNVRHMQHTVVEGKDSLFTWWYPGHRYLHIHCQLNGRLHAFTLSNPNKETKRILQLPCSPPARPGIDYSSPDVHQFCGHKAAEASRGRHHRDSDQLRTVHLFSMLEVWLPDSMFHGHDLHTQYIPFLYSCT